MEGQGLEEKENISITIKELLESGAHFGHQKQRWNPKMKRFIFEERNGICIIDLAKTMQQIRNAVSVVKEVAARKKTILFVGTKKQAKDAIKECAESCGEFYVSERWLGGTLTNLTTIRQSVKTLERIEKRISAGGEGLTKKEISRLSKEQVKLDRNLSGIRAMRKPPALVIVVDPGQEHIAVAEANKLGIPVLALVDTNCDPDPIDHIIACNDDSLKSIKMILQELATAIIEKKKELNISFLKGEEEAMQPEVELAEEVEAEEKGLEPVKSEGEPL
ncbi:MAG: 30S ribosomal protein S2 [Chlamydiae bacterium GWC2_50_10]|nr:MAG: 30S ribosomal protein S2 [Chlamydiae bacterium GWA2_50_15]OGN54421.1 MAG: 30S ribosomal protein S2 [Chlamydiae bacterium GWC2_50_10]OGN57945.1 MAG: 30S ribosomal protein S2 [Chlamydiae bacterium RIFCSPHIGHO2_02_FULL_49_29]OGN63642.1 MAG: 30S ribosomal protein S2 [Chlamydiae bacterium RIFCSPHIGHO2_12_FULL_49_32]OGN71125.1 MAG: 30S ribosomal protein S2 [Chlamydiae bacterium RIFCSPLOWO2_02_FULL_49_12]OGN73349.1 MAG: 30S ribosomal protein S2 [Chlamydiae bacterium RIFCSPLOWO2_12_FULL_49_12]